MFIVSPIHVICHVYVVIFDYYYNSVIRREEIVKFIST